MMRRSLYPFADPLAKFRCFADGDDPADPGAGGGAGGDPGAADPGANGGGSGDDPGAAPPAPVAAPDWRDKQIAKQTRQLHEERARKAELEAENARLRELADAASRRAPVADPAAPPPAAPPPEPRRAAEPTPPVTEADVRRKIEVENMDRVLRAEYATVLPTIMENLGRFDVAERNAIVGDALNTDDPAYVMSVVGADPAKLAELADLPPGRRQAALIKIAMTKTAAPPKPSRPSGAPPPVDPVRGTGGGTPPATATDLYDERFNFSNYYKGPKEIDPEKAADDAWFAERQRQKRESTGRPWSVGGTGGPRR